MSDSTHDEGHSSPIKTPKQLFCRSAWRPSCCRCSSSSGWWPTSPRATRPRPARPTWSAPSPQRLQKVGTVEIRDANRPLASGEEVYKTQCAACHATGVSGAPKFQNAGDWGPRLGQGYAALLNSSRSRGRAPWRRRAVATSATWRSAAPWSMANAAGGKLAEPAPPAPPPKPRRPRPWRLLPRRQPGSPAATASPPQPSRAPAATSTAAADPAVGKSVYDKACVTCHAAGVAGAPKLGDKAAWDPRIAQGMDAMDEDRHQRQGRHAAAAPPPPATTSCAPPYSTWWMPPNEAKSRLPDPEKPLDQRLFCSFSQKRQLSCPARLSCASKIDSIDDVGFRPCPGAPLHGLSG